MTNRSLSWTDRDAVASLLDAVAPAPESARLGGSRSTAAGVTPPRPQPIPPRAVVPSPVRVPPPAAAVPVPQPREPELVLPDTGVADRLDALLAWVMQVTQCSGAFVADEHGLTLAAIGVSDAVVSVVGPLMTAVTATRRVPGVEGRAGAIDLSEQSLSWADIPSLQGGFCVGVVATEVVPMKLMRRIAEAARSALGG